MTTVNDTFGTHHQPAGNVMGCNSLCDKQPTQRASHANALPGRPSLSEIVAGHLYATIDDGAEIMRLSKRSFVEEYKSKGYPHIKTLRSVRFHWPTVIKFQSTLK